MRWIRKHMSDEAAEEERKAMKIRMTKLRENKTEEEKDEDRITSSIGMDRIRGNLTHEEAKEERRAAKTRMSRLRGNKTEAEKEKDRLKLMIRMRRLRQNKSKVEAEEERRATKTRMTVRRDVEQCLNDIVRKCTYAFIHDRDIFIYEGQGLRKLNTNPIMKYRIDGISTEEESSEREYDEDFAFRHARIDHDDVVCGCESGIKKIII